MDLRSPGWENTAEQVITLTNDQLRRLINAFGPSVNNDGEFESFIFP